MASHNRKGRKKHGQPFVQLYWHMLDSQAWHKLSMHARAAYIELSRLYNGTNNGRLALATRTLAKRMPCNQRTACRVLRELEDAGFIETVKLGSFGRKDRRASEYRLTSYKCDVTYEPPSRTYNPKLVWEPATEARRASAQTQQMPQAATNGAGHEARDASATPQTPPPTEAPDASHIDSSHGPVPPAAVNGSIAQIEMIRSRHEKFASDFGKYRSN